MGGRRRGKAPGGKGQRAAGARGAKEQKGGGTGEPPRAAAPSDAE
eukprot:gene22632-29842_t